MKVSYLLLISLLVVGALLVPAVSAEEVLNERIDAFVDTSATVKNEYGSYVGQAAINTVRFNQIENHRQVNYVILNGKELPEGTFPTEGRYEITYTLGGVTKPAVMYISASRNILGSITSFRYTVFFEDWDIGALTGAQEVTLNKSLGTYRIRKGPPSGWGGFIAKYYPGAPGVIYYAPPVMAHDVIISSQNAFENQIVVDLENGLYNIQIFRYLGGKYYKSTLNVKNNDTIVYSNSENIDKSVFFDEGEINQIDLTSPDGVIYTYSLSSEPPDTPGTDQPVMRTGTVTMTDHNGTTITGFNVTAVNHYTGEEYTVATETDVAVITLPMERTITIRNPQTGVYEEAPIGYYRFYGQAPGYKMLNEDGIKVSVMPEKYGSYQLCDILVTSESGPLTGKHKFQIRSRSDNSILQTGTVSAKSATTGEWYNTTVSGGIASLILPYDTSNPISQYAGNYYVYATSPGYYDSDYGTQIVVMPHTVSEINTILLTPIGGIPPAGNVTLQIQAFSEYGPGVANASIFIAGVLGAGSDVWNTYTASSTGYLAVSVPGNSTYDIVASAEGYYDSARRIEVFTEAPGLIEMKLYLSGAPTVEPTTQPTGWPTTQPTTQPTGGIPDEDDDSEGFLMQAVRGIGLAFGVGFATAKLIFGMLLALSIGYATAKQLRGGAAEFGLGLLGGTLLGVLIGLLPVWIIVVLLLVVGLYIGNRYVGGANNG